MKFRYLYIVWFVMAGLLAGTSNAHAWSRLTNSFLSQPNGTPFFMEWPADKGTITFLFDMGVTIDAMAITAASPEVAGVATSWNVDLPGAPAPELAFADAGIDFTTANLGTVGGWGFLDDAVNEVVYDADGTILASLGIDPTGGILGIALICGAIFDCPTAADGSDIFDATIILNGLLFAVNACGLGVADPNKVCFQHVLLHEIGHTLGLGHSIVGRHTIASSDGFFPMPDATTRAIMYPFASGQITLKPDDANAINTIYNPQAGTGSIRGFLRDAFSGRPIRGVHVRAIPTGALTEQVGRLSDRLGQGTGEFLISDLAPGTYFLVLEDIDGRGGVGTANIGGLASNAESAIDVIYNGTPKNTREPSLAAAITVLAGAVQNITFFRNGEKVEISGGCSLASAPLSAANALQLFMLLIIPMIGIFFIKRML